jgi:hypothetical protein
MSDSPTMTVLYVKNVGNVLAAFTQVAKAANGVSAADLTGQGLIVRNLWNLRTPPPQVFPDKYVIPPDALDAADVPLDPEVLFVPRIHVYDASQKTLNPLPTAVGSIDLTVAQADFKATQLKVTTTKAAAKVPDDTPVLVQVNGSTLSIPWTGTGTIAKNTNSLTFNHDSLANGTYSVLLLAAGYLPNSLQSIVS